MTSSGYKITKVPRNTVFGFDYQDTRSTEKLLTKN
jgi:hypothetical protein